MSIWKLLGIGGAEAETEDTTPQTATVRKIVDELDHLPADRAKFVAVFAYVLSRVAHADMSICNDETSTMERILVKIGGLPPEQAMIVVQMAKTQNLLFGGTENFSATQEFNRIADRQQKLQLLECLFAVSAADHEITQAEDKTIRQIADELLLEHADFIAVRTGFREHLSVLRGGD